MTKWKSIIILLIDSRQCLIGNHPNRRNCSLRPHDSKNSPISVTLHENRANILCWIKIKRLQTSAFTLYFGKQHFFFFNVFFYIFLFIWLMDWLTNQLMDESLPRIMINCSPKLFVRRCQCYASTARLRVQIEMLNLLLWSVPGARIHMIAIY